MVDRKFSLAAFCAGLVLLCAVAAQADYKAGQRAWEDGRHARAVAQWKVAAKANDARAMLALGLAYAKGLGVPQDYVEAHKWFDLAAARGSARAAPERDALAIEMTARERAEARKLAQAWRPGKKRAAAAKAAKRKPVAQKAAKPKPAAGKQARQTAEQKRLDLQWPAGKEFRDCDFCPQMVVVPAGRFTMGGESEGPRHLVTIVRRFAVSKFEITFAEWDACVNAGGCGGHRAGDRNWGRGQRPAIYVSWRDARSYVRWLQQFLGQPYRMLSEAEWEYAARAGTRSAFPWGAAAGRNRANCKGCGSRWDGRKTAKAGTFPANAFGLHDMHGNVREWVQDCWHASYRGAPADGSARTEGADCRKRVLRGGSWSDIPWDMRSGRRQSGKWKARNSKTGFRVALTLEP